MFYNCNSLETVKLPANLKKIHSSCFAGCENLKELTIPESVTHIGSGAFSSCDNLMIYGKEGSKAIEYAKNNDINYVVA